MSPSRPPLPWPTLLPPLGGWTTNARTHSDNVVISGTHTHSAPGGYLQYALYSIPSLGFVPASSQALVEGIVAALAAAHDSLQPGRLYLSSGQLQGASINRSPTAYAANPAGERSRYQGDVDREMVLLKVRARLQGGAEGGQEVGAAHNLQPPWGRVARIVMAALAPFLFVLHTGGAT